MALSTSAKAGTPSGLRPPFSFRAAGGSGFQQPQPGKIGQTPECPERGQAISIIARYGHRDHRRRGMKTFETGQQPATIGAANVQARHSRARTAAVMFFVSLGLLVGASLGLGFLLGRASSSSLPVGTAATSVAEQLSAVGVAKTVPQIKDFPPNILNEGTLSTTADLPSTTPVSQALSPNVGAKKGGAESSGIAESQALAADSRRLAGAIRQPVTFETKESTPVKILNPMNDPPVGGPSQNAQHWLKLAEEARRQAEESTQANGKRLLLKIADTYERLAQLTTGESRGRHKPRP